MDTIFVKVAIYVTNLNKAFVRLNLYAYMNWISGEGGGDVHFVHFGILAVKWTKWTDKVDIFFFERLPNEHIAYLTQLPITLKIQIWKHI